LVWRGVVAAGLVGGFASGGMAGVRADTLPGGAEGCLATSPGADVTNPAVGPVLHSGRCSYTATRPAGYVAAGDSWTITVSRLSGGSKVPVRVFRGGRNTGPDGACHTSVVAAGQIVDVTVSNGAVFVGDPRSAVITNGPVHADIGFSQNDIACPA
jgi:hypothetical protein